MVIPFSPEAELSVLGCMFNDPKIIEGLKDKIDRFDFYDPINQKLFDLMIEYHTHKKVLSENLILRECKARNILIDPKIVIDISGNNLPEGILNNYIETLLEVSQAREYLQVGKKIQEIASSSQPHVFISDEIEKQLTSITFKKKKAKSVDLIVKDTIKAMRYEKENNVIVK